MANFTEIASRRAARICTPTGSFCSDSDCALSRPSMLGLLDLVRTAVYGRRWYNARLDTVVKGH